MAGADVAVTEADLAELVQDYAMYLGRAGTTDTVAIPVARNGRQEEARLLLGPASQIAVLENDDDSLEAIPLPDVERCIDDLRGRTDRLLGRSTPPVIEDDTAATSFVDFDAY